MDLTYIDRNLARVKADLKAACEAVKRVDSDCSVIVK